MDLPGAWLLLSPAGLFGLLALAIPVLVHLVSRGRGRRVLTGNIEFLRAAPRARVVTLRLTQRLLLLLRMTIIIVATLLLARLALQGTDTADADAAYVTPGWLRSADGATRAEILSREPAVRVLAAGYPRARDYAAEIPMADYDAWPLLAERLSTLRHAGAVDVYAEARSAAFGDHRPDLPNEIRWHLATAGAVPQAAPSRGIVIHDRDGTDHARRIEIALAALKAHRVPQLQWQTCLADDADCRGLPRDWVIWLAAAEPPANVDAAHLYRPQDPSWRLATSDPRYPDRLLDEILGDAQQRRAWSQIPTSATVLAAGAQPAGSVALPHRSLHHWLALLLLALWAVERFLSERRRTANG